jgi:DNA-binding NarL/FixJ family response regulator
MMPIQAETNEMIIALARYEAHEADLAGRAELPPRAESAPPAAHPYPCRLTTREVEILRLIAAGMSNREMAEALCRSERTIERHIENLYRKIGAHSKADATAFAFRHHLA